MSGSRNAKISLQRTRPVKKRNKKTPDIKRAIKKWQGVRQINMPAKRKKNGPFITGIDAGTSKICVVVAEMIDEGIDILSITSSPSAGMRKGVVVNVDSAAT